jgi:hypothetical protein
MKSMEGMESCLFAVCLGLLCDTERSPLHNGERRFNLYNEINKFSGYCGVGNPLFIAH